MVPALSRRRFLAVTAGTMAASMLLRADSPQIIPENLDHLIVGCRNLDEGVAYFEKLSGFRAAPGGSHPGRGTQNALLGLGPRSYLEILAPDPKQGELVWHKEIATLAQPLLIGWALHHPDLQAFADLLRQRGMPAVGPDPGSRVRPDGQAYRWQTLRFADDLKGNLPFFIDWATDSPHPSTDAPGGLVLSEFVATGSLPAIPPPEEKMKLQFVEGKQARMRARFLGKSGPFTLETLAVPAETWAPS